MVVPHLLYKRNHLCTMVITTSEVKEVDPVSALLTIAASAIAALAGWRLVMPLHGIVFRLCGGRRTAPHTTGRWLALCVNIGETPSPLEISVQRAGKGERSWQIRSAGTRFRTR
jgi:hypothetical protein